MSIFTALKGLFKEAETKIEIATTKMLTQEERFTKLALDLTNKIDEFYRSEIKLKAEEVKITKEVNSHSVESKKIEDSIKLKKSKGEEIPTALFKLGYTRELIIKNLEGKVTSIRQALAVIPENVVKLSDKRDDVKLNLELIRLNKVSEDLGLQLPEDITMVADLSLVDVDTVLAKADIIHGNSSTSVDSVGLDLYKAKF